MIVNPVVVGGTSATYSISVIAGGISGLNTYDAAPGQLIEFYFDASAVVGNPDISVSSQSLKVTPTLYTSTRAPTPGREHYGFYMPAYDVTIGMQ